MLPNSAFLDRPSLDLSAMAAWAHSKSKLDSSSFPGSSLAPEQKSKARSLLGDDLDLDLLVVPQGRQIETLHTAPFVPQQSATSVDSKAIPLSSFSSSSSSSSSYADLSTILKRQHNGMVYAACEDIESSLSIQRSAWLCEKSAEEWERSKELLSQILGLPSATSQHASSSMQNRGRGYQTPAPHAAGVGVVGMTPAFLLTDDDTTTIAKNNTSSSISTPLDYTQSMAKSAVHLAESFISGQDRIRPIALLGKASSEFHRLVQQQQPQKIINGSEEASSRLWSLLHQVLGREEALSEAPPRSSPLWTQWAITGMSQLQQQHARNVLNAVDLDNPLEDLQLFGSCKSTDAMLERWAFKSLQYLHELYRETRDDSPGGGAGSSIHYVTLHLNWLARSGVSREISSALLFSKQQFEAPIPSRDAQFGLFPCLFFLLRRGSIDEAAQYAFDAANNAHVRGTQSVLLDSVAFALEAYKEFFKRAILPSADKFLSANNPHADSVMHASSVGTFHTSVHLSGSTLGASIQFDTKSLKAIGECRKRALDFEASIDSRIGGEGRQQQQHCPFQPAVLHMLGGDASMLSPAHDHPLFSLVLSSSSILPAQRQQVLYGGTGQQQQQTRADSDDLKRELTWFRLWFAATSKVAASSSSASSMSSFQMSSAFAGSTRSSSSSSSLSCSLLDIGAITIEEIELEMQSVLAASKVGGGGGGGGIVSSSSSSSSSTTTSSTFSALSAYGACERLILAGQPEYALAFLATHGNVDTGRGLHDALHMGLALSWHGALRTYPISLARKKALFSGDKAASTADVLVERMKSEAGTEIAGKGARVGKYLLYSIRSRQALATQTTDMSPRHLLDLPFLMENYFSRILQPSNSTSLIENAYTKACYATLLPHAASRVSLISQQSLMHFPNLAVELFIKPLEPMQGGRSSRLTEAIETLRLSALLCKESGSVINSVLLFRYTSSLSKTSDGVLEAIKIATIELAKVASVSWAAITEGRLLHRGALTQDVSDKKMLRTDLYRALTEIRHSLLHISHTHIELREWQIQAERVCNMCEFYDFLVTKNAQSWDSVLLNRISTGLFFPSVDEINMRSAWKILLESLPSDMKKAYDDLLFATASAIRHVQQTQSKVITSKFKPHVRMLQQAKIVLDELSINLSTTTKEKLSEVRDD